ncbi:MAG: DUF4412 domain-containing protein [Oceanipulchritudo sp.]
MKRSIRILFLLLFALRLCATEPFEGSFDMTVDAEGEKATLSVTTKEGDIHMKMKGGDAPGEMIFREGMSTMLVLMPEQRMYMEMPLKGEMTGPGPGSAPPQEEPGEIPFKKTGRTREIQGYTAHEFIVENEGGKTEIWASEELGSMPFVHNPMFGGASDPMRKFTGLSAFFPLEVNGYKGDKPEYRMTITRIEKKKVDDALFQPPPGFQRFSMPGGMGGLMER